MSNFVQRGVVLVVDDSPENLDVLSAVLADDYSIKACTSGQKALEIALGADPPDLILLDVVMPELDGFETCRRLKAHRKTRNIPVLFVTAKGEMEDESTGFAVGGVDYITKPISPSTVQARVRTHLALYDQNRTLEQMVRVRTKELDDSRYQIIQRLGQAAEFKDKETGSHIMRMSRYAEVIAKGAGLHETEQVLVLHSSPMHDVGKIGIPDQILQKEGPLSDDEWVVMKTHTQIGARIIGTHHSELLQMAATTALCHHEKWDGSGYPQGLANVRIPLVGRIAAIADVFDALTSKRPYKDIWSFEAALEYLQAESGTHFDPALIEVFLGEQSVIEGIMNEYGDE